MHKSRLVSVKVICHVALQYTKVRSQDELSQTIRISLEVVSYFETERKPPLHQEDDRTLSDYNRQEEATLEDELATPCTEPGSWKME